MCGIVKRGRNGWPDRSLESFLCCISSPFKEIQSSLAAQKCVIESIPTGYDQEGYSKGPPGLRQKDTAETGEDRLFFFGGFVTGVTSPRHMEILTIHSIVIV